MNSKLEIRGFCCFLRRMIIALDLRYNEMEEIAINFIEEQRKKKGHYSYDNSILLKKVIMYEFQRPCVASGMLIKETQGHLKNHTVNDVEVIDLS